MLTGRRAFEGESITDILGAVLRAEPEWSRLPPDTPAAIQRLLRRALKKDVHQRLGDIRDARLEIEETSTEAGAPERPSNRVLPERRRLPWILVTVLSFVVAVMAIPTRQHLREGVSDPREMRTDIMTPATSEASSFALSPDGRQIVFVASGDGLPRLWLRPLDKATGQPLAGTEGASHPFWSPDSRSIGFFDGTKLKRIDIGSGSPQTLADAAPRGGTWSPEGVILFTPSFSGPLSRIPASGGAAVAVTKVEKQVSHRYPQFLPGGRQFLFYALGTPQAQGIYWGTLDAPETKFLTAADGGGVYAPNGWLLFIRQGTFLAQRLDIARRELIGDPVAIADQLGIDTGFATPISASIGALVAYRVGGTSRSQLTWFDRTGKPLGTMGPPDGNGLSSPNLSPDGGRAVVHRSVQGNYDVWLVDADRTTRFTFDASADQFPLWSPDGRRVVFRSARNGHFDLYEKSLNGAGSDQLLMKSDQDKFVDDWSADGRFVVYDVNDPQGFSDLWVLPLEGDRKPKIFLRTEFDEAMAKFSPDGQWIAYQSNQSGRYEIYVRPFSGSGGEWQMSTAGGISPRWAASGKELYYIAPDSTLMSVAIRINGATITPGRPAPLFRTRILGGGTDPSPGTNYDVTRDGRFLINTVLDEVPLPITLLQNWKPPAK
jgi:Tol biopolymer transport system component